MEKRNCLYSFRARVSMPPNRGSSFAGLLPLSEWNFEQDAEVPSLPETIEASMKQSPVPHKVMNSREAAPLGQPRTDHLTLTCVLLTGQPQNNGLIEGDAITLFDGMDIPPHPETTLAFIVESKLAEDSAGLGLKLKAFEIGIRASITDQGATLSACFLHIRDDAKTLPRMSQE
jgi:hypothetical protein